MKGELKKKWQEVRKRCPALEWAVYGGLILVALLLFFASPGEEEEQKEAAAEPAAMANASLEERMEDTLSKIEGAGKVRVLISYESSEEIVPAVSRSEQGGRGSLSEQPVTVSGAEGETAMVLMKKSATVRGAVVVAEGAQDLSVRTDLLRAGAGRAGRAIVEDRGFSHGRGNEKGERHESAGDPGKEQKEHDARGKNRP